MYTSMIRKWKLEHKNIWLKLAKFLESLRKLDKRELVYNLYIVSERLSMVNK